MLKKLDRYAIVTSTVCESLAELTREGLVVREAGGYQLELRLEANPRTAAFPASCPKDPQGNGNGKHPLES